MQPAARGDAVGDVAELVWPVDGDEVLEDGGLDEVGVQFGDAIDLVRADDGDVSHADHLGLSLFDDGDAAEQVVVLGELALDVLQEGHVDLVDDLEVTGQQVLHQRDRPLLQCLGEDGVVCIAEGVGDETPGLVPVEAFLIDEDTLELDNG